MIKNLYQKCLAEFIGTFALLFFGCGSIMLGTIPDFAVPLIFGAIVATMIYTVGHISGAHLNPAVTLAFAITRHFPVRQVIPYWLAQFIGGIAAIALLSTIMPASASYGATIPTVSTSIALIWEIVLSAFLMFVIIAVATDTRAEGVMAGIAIGTIVALCSYLGGTFTGASMNPARSLAPALFQDTMNIMWIYLTAPFIGTTIGAAIYQLIRCDISNKNARGCC
ncbi:MAG: aquaporin [Rickettsiales bacterium]